MLLLNKRLTSILFFFISLLLASYLVNFVLLKIVFSVHTTINNDHFIAAREIYEINSRKYNDIDKIIIFGSSMSREGIDQDYLMDNGLKLFQIYNISVSSGTPADSYLMLNNIKNKESIKLAIIALAPWQFQKEYTQDFNKSLGAHLFFKPIPILFLYDKNRPEQTWFLKNSVASLFNFYKYNDHLKQLIDYNNLSFWKTEEERIKKPAIWQQYKYSENKPEAYFVNELNKEENYIKYSNGNYHWEIESNIQLKALANFFRELENENIPSIIINMPVNPQKEKFYEKELRGNYKQAVMSVLPSNGEFYDYSSCYNKDYFIDFNHLNEKGRLQLSQELEKIIEKNYAL